MKVGQKREGKRSSLDEKTGSEYRTAESESRWRLGMIDICPYGGDTMPDNCREKDVGIHEFEYRAGLPASNQVCVLDREDFC